MDIPSETPALRWTLRRIAALVAAKDRPKSTGTTVLVIDGLDQLDTVRVEDLMALLNCFRDFPEQLTALVSVASDAPISEVSFCAAFSMIEKAHPMTQGH